MTITITEKQSNFAFGNNKAPKNAKGSKTNYGTETSSVNNTYLKSSDLVRQNKNETQSQQRRMYKTLEGVVVNNFIKDDRNPALNMDDICNSLVIPDTFNKSAYNKPATKEEIKNEKKSSMLRSVFPLAAFSLIAAGGILGLTALMKKSAISLNDPNVLRQERLPNLGMNMNIKQEHEFGAYMALRNPNKKTILAMIGIFIMSGLTLLGKNLVDGIQEIWVKKKEADANKKLQEGLIDIETRTFAGKLDVINEALVDKANYFKNILNSIPENSASSNFSQSAAELTSTGAVEAQKPNPFLNFFGFGNNAFKGASGTIFFKGGQIADDSKNITFADEQNKSDEAKDIKNSPLLIGAIAIGTLAAGILMGKKMFKNFVDADAEIRKFVKNGTNEIEAQIGKLVEKLKNTDNKEDANVEFTRLKELLQIKRADSFEVQNALKDIPFLNEEDVAQNTLDIMTGIKSIYGDAPETLGGKVGQIQYYCYLDEARGHIYNWIMNPENPFAKYLFLTLTTVNAAGYSIRKAIEGVKEAAVIQENKNTEKNLQERLIDTEIRNFKSKKQSAIEPMMNEFNTKLNSGASKQELKVMADNILLEIKNGPPFVYA